MIVKRLLYIASFILIPVLSYGQYGIGLYHLGNKVVQTNHMNPAFVPDGKAWVALPFSASLDFNSSHSFSEYFTKSEGQQNLDYDNILRNAKKDNALIFQGRLNTLSLGFKLGEDGGYLSLFTNERVSAFMSYPKDVITLIAKGNTAFAGSKVELGDLRFSVNYFREIGLGYTFKPSKKLIVGVRPKYLIGLANGHSDKNAKITLETQEENFETAITFSNAAIYLHDTEGINPAGSGAGIGLDLGVDYQLNRLVSLNFAANDLGSIKWSGNGSATKIFIEDSRNFYDGIDLEEISEDIFGDIVDSVAEITSRDTLQEDYRTTLAPNFIAGARIRIAPRHEAFVTASSTLYFGRPKTLIGVGYGFDVTKWMSASVNAVKPPQQLIDFGGSLVFDFGAFQSYLAIDKTLGYTNVSKASGVDISFGLNLIFGRPKTKKSDEYESNYEDNYWDLDPLNRPKKDVKVGHRHIYDIVQKDEPPSKWKRWLGRKEKKIKKIHSKGRKPKSTRNGLK